MVTTEAGQAALDADQSLVLLAEVASVRSPSSSQSPDAASNAVTSKVVNGSTGLAKGSKGLLIRRGGLDDREGLRLLLRQHHANSVFRAQAFSDRKFDAQFAFLATHPDNILALVAEYRGAVVGAAWAQCDHYMLSEGPPFVAVQLIAVEQEALNQVGRTKVFLGLIAAVRQWKADKGASHVQVNVTTGTSLATTDKLLRAVGAAFAGGNYLV